ncbi:MAG: glycosyltransferase N-terminal domain-containing protein [Crocinitomicaceae bacterium]
MSLLYSFGIFLYGCLLHFATLFNQKAKKWVNGRKHWKQNLKAAIAKNEHVIWFHCASLGEFEQGRPIIETIRKKYPTHFILLTFFSPSGYEIRKNYTGADYVCYLPLDTKANARYFIQTAHPKMVFFVKYEFWANFLFQLKKENIPTYSISAIFRKDQHFFKKNRRFSKKILSCFTHFFVQNEASKDLLNSIGINRVTVSGDTRFDRVSDNANSVSKNELLERFTKNATTLVMGSSWPIDEEMIFPFINNGEFKEKIIIAPHEVNEKHIANICSQLNVSFKRYSLCNDQTDIENTQVLIIDSIGLLASAYYYGTYAYIGGAFERGLHNILEATVFGLPVIFGPKHTKFPEAQEFIDAGFGFSISSSSEFEVARKLILENTPVLKEKAIHFMQSKKGAREIILSEL